MAGKPPMHQKMLGKPGNGMISRQIAQQNFQKTDFEKEMDLVAEKRNTQKNSNKFNFFISTKRIRRGELR
jgi:hypothetical protein